MRDDLLPNYLYRIEPRHPASSGLHQAIRGMSDVVAHARSVRQQKGQEAAATLIRGELIPQFARHAEVISAGLTSARDTQIRDDYGTGIGASIHYRRLLQEIGRVSESQWSLIEMDAKKGAAA